MSAGESFHAVAQAGTARAARGGTLLLGTALLLIALLPATASAGPLWSSTPSPFPCTGPNGTIVRSNACVAHTGFKPNTSYWGQATNPLGNCTNYVAYRLERNGATRLASSFGNAVGWRGVVQQKLGSGAVNGTPKVGSIAWWGASGRMAPYGHVAYVEKVSADGKTVYLSESHYALGSRRLTVQRGSSYWPESFLHIKDQPKKKSPPVKPPPLPEEEEEGEEEESPSDPPSPGGPSAADRTPPTSPTSVAASAPSTSTITLSWGRATDKVGVAGYSVYRSGSRLANTGSTSYRFTGLSCGSSYKLGVDAYDAAGNRSSTVSVTASTSACPKKVTVSKGARKNVSGCVSTACAYMTVSFSNFSSGSHTVVCYSDYPPPTGAFYQYTTSSTTSNVCVYGYLSTHVWVTVDGIESNHLTW